MIHGAFCGPWAWDGFAAKFRDQPAIEVHHARACAIMMAASRPPALGTTSLTDYAADLEDD